MMLVHNYQVLPVRHLILMLDIELVMVKLIKDIMYRLVLKLDMQMVVIHRLV